MKTITNHYFLSIIIVLTFFVNTSMISAQKSDKFVVVLDAGHGGHDPGRPTKFGYKEKDIALKIVLAIGEKLSKNPSIEVVYTRSTDKFIELKERGRIANKANADLFVSVHCDSHTSNAHGAGTFVLGLHANKQNFEIAKKENSVIYLEDNYENRYADYDINSPESVIGLTIMQEEFLDQSITLAKTIQDNFANKLKRNDRQVKQAGFIVLHQTFMPSVLVETGFLTNDKEGAYLNSSKGQSEMGTAIANAIITYRSQAQIGSTIVEQPRPTKTPEPKKVSEPPIAAQQEEASKPVETVVVKTEEPIVEQQKAPVIQKPKEIQTASTKVPKTKVEKKEVTKPTPKKAIKKPTPTKPSIEYRVQILASAKNIALTGSNFNGLNNLSKEPYKNLYRYMYGRVNSMQGAKLLKSNADLKGYSSSYIVAYKDGKRISIKEANKYVSQ